MDVQRGGGLPLLVGDIGLPQVPITIIAPSGLQTQVMSGSKPEYGLGGFETYASETGDYVVQFLDQAFVVPMSGQFTKVIFRRQEVVPEEQVRLVSGWMPVDVY